MKFNGAKCRFCQCSLDLQVEDSTIETLPNVVPLLFKLAEKCCCNRCADYYRSKYDLTKALCHLALVMKRERESYTCNEKIVTTAIEGIERIIRKIISIAEDFYFLADLQKESFDEFRNAVLNKLDSVWIAVDLFNKGVSAISKDVHSRPAPEPRQYKDA